MTVQMRKTINFDRFHGEGWPDANELRFYFLAPVGREWFSTGGNDSAGLGAEGLNGTMHSPRGKGRIDVHLYLSGKPGVGVMFTYNRGGGGGPKVECCSLGDASRLGEKVENLEGYLHPVGLHIPFDRAFLVVKQFIETEGELPTCVDWIASRDLPPDSFPV